MANLSLRDRVARNKRKYPDHLPIGLFDGKQQIFDPWNYEYLIDGELLQPDLVRHVNIRRGIVVIYESEPGLFYVSAPGVRHQRIADYEQGRIKMYLRNGKVEAKRCRNLPCPGP